MSSQIPVIISFNNFERFDTSQIELIFNTSTREELENLCAK